MGTELPTKVMLGQTLVLMQMRFLNNLRKVGRLVLPRTSFWFLFARKNLQNSVTPVNTVRCWTCFMSQTFSVSRNFVTSRCVLSNSVLLCQDTHC
jgi:hypothetical protein